MQKRTIYLVGGAVRDELLGLEPKDRDFVVVGSTEEEMLALGFSKVGADFPVFLHPDTGEEYALARRERSTGPGYNDFEVEFSPDVTIEEDLGRRDFTMNAIAKDIETSEYIDPYNGQNDIQFRKLTMVHEKAFLEDPVRILRMARFTSQFPAFRVSYSTEKAARIGNIGFATPERVTKELEKALMGAKPSEFFDTLFSIGQTEAWFKEIFALWGVPQPIKYHAEGCAYQHTMMVLDSAAKHNESLEVRFGCLVHDLGKALTPKHKLPRHLGHEAAGVQPTNDLCDRLKLSNDLRQAGTLSAKFHMICHKAYEMGPKGYVNTFESFRNCVDISEIVAKVAWHDNQGRLPYESYNGENERFVSVLKHLKTIKLSADYSSEQIEAMSIENRKGTLHKMRLNAVKRMV